MDLLLERDRLLAAGVASYWLVDPDEPSLLALELREGSYVELAHVRGDKACELSVPLPVRIASTELLD